MAGSIARTRPTRSAVLAGRLLVAAAAAVLALAPRPVLASCVVPPPLDEVLPQAESAFVGTVTAATNANRWASVAVEEIWVGPLLPEAVEVRGSEAAIDGAPGEPEAVFTSVDRQYQVGQRYLFVVNIVEGRLSDNACSSTTEWSPELAALRPAGAREPEPAAQPEASGGSDLATLAAPIAAVAAVGLLVFGAAFALRRRTG